MKKDAGDLKFPRQAAERPQENARSESVEMKKAASQPNGAGQAAESAQQAKERQEEAERRETAQPGEAERRETVQPGEAERRETIQPGESEPRQNGQAAERPSAKGPIANALSATGEASELKEYADEDIPQYLKQYISQHPSSKMAWYLLGKEYERQGKDAKARYCYTRSEEIYAAFEMKSFTQPSDEGLSAAAVGEHVKRPDSRQRRTILALLFILLLLVLPSSLDNGTAGEVGPLASQGGGTEAKKPQSSPEGQYIEFPTPYDPQQGGSSKIILGAIDEPFSPSAATGINRLLGHSASSQNTLWGVLKKSESWALWGEGVRAMAAMRSSEQSGRYELEIYDSDLCQCEPVEGKDAQQTLTAWMSGTEELLVLQTAIIGYYKLNGAPPAALSELTGSYPDNVLSGTTTRMEAAFDFYKDKLFDDNGQLQSPAVPGAESSGRPVAGDEVTIAAPLEIIVDKKNYRLALVSGNTIIRNYPVGLGGSRTPEGEFHISEKVVDPQGKNNNEFGTRGMTLSDTLYAIHGTNQQSSIEQDRSLGCIRMLNEDVEELYGMVPMGTKVSIVNNGLPESIERGVPRMELPVRDNETNPGKIYEWLN